MRRIHDTAEADAPPIALEADAPTFEEFYRTNRDRLVRLLALDLRDLDVAAEAIDVAMSRAWQRWELLDDRRDAGAWVYRVARNWATSWFRRRRRLRVGDVPDRGIETRYAVEDEDVRTALAALTDRHRAVVVLRVHAGLSTADTATALGIPPGTVKSRLARALDQLRSTLEDGR